MRSKHKNTSTRTPYIQTHNLLVRVGAGGVGGGQGGGTQLTIPGEVACLRGAADGEGANRGRVAVTVTVVTHRPAVTRRPHVDGALAAPPLEKVMVLVLLFDGVMVVVWRSW